MKLPNFLSRKVDAADIESYAKLLMAKATYEDLALAIGISYIANAISKCEIKVFEGHQEVRNELYYKLNVSPNQNQNSSQFMNQIIERIYLEGEAVVFAHRNNLFVSDGWQIDKHPLSQDVFKSITVDKHPTRLNKKAGDVFHFYLDNQPVKKLIDSVYADYGTVLQSAISAFKRTNGIKYKLDLGGKKAGNAEFNEEFEKVIKKQLSAFMEADNAVYPQFDGYDLQIMGNTGQGSQYGSSSEVITIRKDAFDIVAQALKIPLPLMYGNITNMKEIVNLFLTFCVDPLADMISEELTRKTSDFSRWSSGCRVKIDTSSISHIDIIDTAEKLDKLIASGLFNIDSVLKLIKQEPLNTPFSKQHFMTKNYDLIENILKQLGDGGGEKNGK